MNRLSSTEQTRRRNAGTAGALAMVCALVLVGCSPGLKFKVGSSNNEVNDQTDAQIRAAFQGAGIVTPPAQAAPPAALVALGKDLYFDKILSGNKNISCSTCHSPLTDPSTLAGLATGDGLPSSIGEGGTGLGALRSAGGPVNTSTRALLSPRNALPVFNLGLAGIAVLMWDGSIQRDPTSGDITTPDPQHALDGSSPALPAVAGQLNSALAVQAMIPPTNPGEMLGQSGSNDISQFAGIDAQIWQALSNRIQAVPQYQQMFSAAFPGTAPGSFNFGHAAAAIAAFETAAWTRTGAPLDRYLQGDDTALSDSDKRGAALFLGTAKCARCHSGPLLTDFGYHSIAAPQLGPGRLPNGDDTGRGFVTNQASDNYKFRTPSLRNVCLTAPWTHAGAYSDIRQVVLHHLDPANALVNFDPNQIQRADYRATLDTTPVLIQNRIASIDPILQTPISLSSGDVSDLVNFLCDALTDPQSLSQTALETPPSSVPSGLPVGD